MKAASDTTTAINQGLTVNLGGVPGGDATLGLELIDLSK